MAEYIEREAAMAVVRHAWAKGLEPSQYIEELSAADVVEVVHGRWEKYVTVGKDMFGNRTEVVFACNCSVCGLDGRTDTNYCPNCGAKMDLEG